MYHPRLTNCWLGLVTSFFSLSLCFFSFSFFSKAFSSKIKWVFLFKIFLFYSVLFPPFYPVFISVISLFILLEPLLLLLYLAKSPVLIVSHLLYFYYQFWSLTEARMIFDWLTIKREFRRKRKIIVWRSNVNEKDISYIV